MCNWFLDISLGVQGYDDEVGGLIHDNNFIFIKKKINEVSDAFYFLDVSLSKDTP